MSKYGVVVDAVCRPVQSSGYFAGLLTVRFGVQTPARAEIWFQISVPSAPPSQFTYDGYTDRTMSVGRPDGEGEDWPPALLCQAKKMKLLTLHTQGCPAASLRDCSDISSSFMQINATRSSTDLIILADFNIDLLKINEPKETNAFYNCFTSHQLMMLIPTIRVAFRKAATGQYAYD